ncbi:MAG: zinc ribbon domain-containing protein [Acidimicrobiales bacterium]
MSGPLAQLLVVQDLDTAITQLEHRRVALAERTGLKGLEAELAVLRADEASLTERRAELVATQRDIEGQIAAITERRTLTEQRMYAARGSSTRDLQAMDDEVRHLARRQAELEELDLVAMVNQEPLDAELASLVARRAPLEERVAVVGAEVGAEQRAIDEELTAARAARAAAAAELPAALAERYERLRTRLHGTGAARLVGRRCDGCHLELSAVEVDRIRAMPPDTVATCDQCGRILVPV